jgi:Clustered mitochondria
VGDILFKFAVDSHKLFGGDDFAAAKVAGHDRKGLIAYFDCKNPHLHFPLLALVDFLVCSNFSVR